jgi:hypothetical protein
MKVRNNKMSGGVGRAIFRAGIVLGAGVAGALLFRLPGIGRIEALLIPATLPLAAVIGVVWDNRVQARRRWQAAWDAYALSETFREPIPAVEQESAFAVAAAH